MECRTAESRLVELCFGQVSPATAEWLLAHLANCQGCRDLAAALILLFALERVVKQERSGTATILKQPLNSL